MTSCAPVHSGVAELHLISRLRSCERIMKQTSHHRDTEALRNEKKGPYLCASVSLWFMQSISSQLLTRWAIQLGEPPPLAGRQQGFDSYGNPCSWRESNPSPPRQAKRGAPHPRPLVKARGAGHPLPWEREKNPCGGAATPREELSLLPGEKVVEVRDRMRGLFQPL
jgi:hypothetical protein